MIAELGSIHGPRVPTTRARIDFWHGVDWSRDWDSTWGLVQQRQRWVKARFGDAAFEDKPLLEEFSDFDLLDGGHSLNQYVALLRPADLGKMKLLVGQQATEHDAHHFVRFRPFCPSCRRSKTIAMLSLASWMVRHPGRIPANPSDTDLTWDTEQVLEPPTTNQAALYMSPLQLSAMPPPIELIKGILPAKGVGYITGRDRSLKTFLALDICMHVATMAPYWHAAGEDAQDHARREMGWGKYGRIIFAAGEGVSSFWPRIQAWEQAQHVKGYGMGSPRTKAGEDAIRVGNCALCASELDPHVGHVNHLADGPGNVDVLAPGIGEVAHENITIRRGTVDLFAGGEDYRYMLALARKQQPDVIVLDTLALSSGAADQQSNGDMGQIHSRAAALAEASDGLVILIAHTDKGDNDARGASAIEDNADFVLHCHRESNEELNVKVAKRKDADDNWMFKLQVQTVELGMAGMGGSSLILRDWDGSLDPEPEVEGREVEEQIIQKMATLAVGDGDPSFTMKHAEDWTGMSRGTLQRQIQHLLDRNALTYTLGEKGAKIYHLGPGPLERLRAFGYGMGGEA